MLQYVLKLTNFLVQMKMSVCTYFSYKHITLRRMISSALLLQLVTGLCYIYLYPGILTALKKKYPKQIQASYRTINGIVQTSSDGQDYAFESLLNRHNGHGIRNGSLKSTPTLFGMDRIESLSNAGNESRTSDKNVGGDRKQTMLRYNIFGNPAQRNGTNNTRKDECNKCFRHEFNYVIDNPDICKLRSGQKGIDLLIVVTTVHKNTYQRHVLRKTWLTYSKNSTANVRYAFLLGEMKDSALQDLVFKESLQFRDIVKEDFVDVYNNLTYKTIMGFKWASSKCNIAKAVLKTDDDVYINVPNVLRIARKHATDLQDSIAGYCLTNVAPMRDSRYKWFASIQSYPGKLYPGYCSGTGYLASMKIVQKIFEISPNVPYFHLEDVYVALCIKKLGYHLKSVPGFNPSRPKYGDPCLYKSERLASAHPMDPDMIEEIWTSKC